MTARIYRPAKTAMQSGRALTREWVLEFAPETPRKVEPLMGWTSSSDMKSQIRMRFPNVEDAVAYCRRNGIPYRIEEEKPRRPRRATAYSDNFRFGRIGTWTH
jgi:hypothetical protein